jgi:hypothetical protein
MGAGSKKTKVNYAKERCYKCGSYNLVVVRDSTWPSLMCAECGAHVRDFGD